MAECVTEQQEVQSSSTRDITLKDTIQFRVVWKKRNYEVTFPLDHKVAKLKEHIQQLTGIPPAMMKLMYKGLVKDDQTLRELKVVPGAKMMVVGSTIDDVITVQPPSPGELKKLQNDTAPVPPKESLSEHKDHKKMIEKGKPEDAPVGIKHRKILSHSRGEKSGEGLVLLRHHGPEMVDLDPLPTQPLSGMINKYGAKVRLHFKLELDQLWIGTKERTDKIPLGSIKKVTSEPIKGHEEYHIMALQLGPTELSRYWIYWVPSQYVDAIKDAILGKWQYF